MSTGLRDRIEQERQDLAKDYAQVFGTTAGQRVLADIKRRGFYGRTTQQAPMQGHPIDPMLAASNEGMRRLALIIVEMIEIGKQGITEPTRAVPSVTRRMPEEEPAWASSTGPS